MDDYSRIEKILNDIEETNKQLWVHIKSELIHINTIMAQVNKPLKIRLNQINEIYKKILKWAETSQYPKIDELKSDYNDFQQKYNIKENSMNKNKLYEKIMKRVAREVKQALNEDVNTGLKDNAFAVQNTIVKLFQNHNIDYVAIDPDIDSYYNDAMLDDLGQEVTYFSVDYNNTLRVGIWNKEINVNRLSAKDLDTLYYIAKFIVADRTGNPESYEIDEEMDTIYQSALAGTLHVGYDITDEDKERLYKAFEECGYDKCDFLKVDGEPIVLDSIYNDENVSIDIISANLVCKLSNGEVVQLENIISDLDDIDTLVDVITDYEE